MRFIVQLNIEHFTEMKTACQEIVEADVANAFLFEKDFEVSFSARAMLYTN